MLTSTQLLPLLPVFLFLKHTHSIFPFCSLSVSFSLKSNCPRFCHGTDRAISHQGSLLGGGEEEARGEEMRSKKGNGEEGERKRGAGEQRELSAAFCIIGSVAECECNTQSFITGAQGLSL